MVIILLSVCVRVCSSGKKERNSGRMRISGERIRARERERKERRREKIDDRRMIEIEPKKRTLR